MIGLVPAGVLLLSVGLVVALRRFRPAFQSFWFVLASGTVLSWLSLPVLRLFWPLAEERAYWSLASIFDIGLAFGSDIVSWSSGFVLLTLLLAGVSTDVILEGNPEWRSRTLAILAGGIGLAAVHAGNLYTLFLALLLLDITVLAIYIGTARDQSTLRRVMFGFGARIAGSGLLLLAAVFAELEGAQPAGATTLSGWLALLAGIARLGLVPSGWGRSVSGQPNQQFALIAHLALYIAGLVLILRTLSATSLAVSAEGGLAPLPFIILAILSLAASLGWLNFRSLWHDRNSLLGAATGLVMASELRALPMSGLVWGLSWVLAAGLFSSISGGGRFVSLSALLSLWTVSMLPYSATWDGNRLFAPPFHPILLLLLVVQGLLLAGCFWRIFRIEGGSPATERWIGVLYPVALFIHPVAALSIAWVPWQGLGWILANPWWPGLVAVALSALAWWRLSDLDHGIDLPFIRRSFRLILRIATPITRALAGAVERTTRALTGVLEGEGGVLWALLVMALLLSLLTQLGNRGG